MNKLEETAKSLDPSGQTVIPVQCDVTDQSSISSAVKIIETDVNYVDVVINNAGISGPNHRQVYGAGSISELQSILLADWQGWSDTHAVNTTAVVGVAAAFLHLLDAANSRKGWASGKVADGPPGAKGRSRTVPDGADANDSRTSQIITIAR